MSLVRRILNALVGKPARSAKVIPAQLMRSDLPSSPVCAFCGRAATNGGPATEELSAVGCLRLIAHTAGLWACTCTAIGSGAWAPDLDEAADLLLAVVDMESLRGQPWVPLGGSEKISVPECDLYGLIEPLRESLRQRHYELRVNAFDQNSVPIQCLWARRLVASLA
jgi:hypothetical protein